MTGIKTLGKDLALYNTITTYCPACQDSRSNKYEKTLSVTRKLEGLLYICHRQSCKFNKGGIVSERIQGARIINPKEFVPKVLNRPLVPLSFYLWSKMIEQYDISLEECQVQGFKWDKYANRLYMPVYDYRGYEIGGQAKASQKGIVPKVIGYRHNDVPMLHFPLGQEIGDSLVLVEDIFSAIKVSKTRPCAALLGTNLIDGMMKQLLDMGIKTVYLMLDGDAIKKAIKIRHDKGYMFWRFFLVALSPELDPKDLSYEELQRRLQ